MKQFFKYMFLAVACLTLSASFVSCSSDDDDDSGKKEKEYDQTYLHAMIDFTYVDLFDFSFTLDGKAIEMKKEVSGNKIDFTWTENKLHDGQKVKCTVKAKSSADFTTVAKDYSLRAGCSYISGTFTEGGTSASQIAASVSEFKQSGNIEGKEDIAASTFESAIGTFLSDTID